MTIYAVFNVYEEGRMLPGAMESVYDQVDEIVVVDGAYAAFPHEHYASRDATLAIARAYGARVIEAPGRAWRNESEKRNRFFVGQPGDWYLQIDADERLEGELPPLDPDVVQYTLTMYHSGSFHNQIRRLYQHVEGIHYHERCHCALWSANGPILRDGAQHIPPDQARLIHLKHLRDPARQAPKRGYYTWLERYEREYRDGHQL